MCKKEEHTSSRRNVCLCLAVYIIFGLRINCGVLCLTNHAFPPNDHLDSLFRNVSNDTNTVDEMKLEAFLDALHLHSDSVNNHSHLEEKCFSAGEMLGFFPNGVTYLDKSQFSQILPTVVYQLRMDTCKHVEEKPSRELSFDWKAFLAATASVLVVSASGLVVVCLVPLMSRSFYNVVTQFLIALSVGSLTGDAFLHLIPHALFNHHHHNEGESHGHDHDHHGEHSDSPSHEQMIFKALVALLGIYAFFLTERLTIICQNRMSRKKMKRQLANANVHSSEFLEMPNGEVRSHHNHVENAMGGEPGSQNHPPLDHDELSTNKGAKSGDCRSGLKTRGEPNNSNTCPHLGAPEVRQGDESSIPCPEGQLCNRPPDRPLDNNRCTDYLNAPAKESNNASHWCTPTNLGTHSTRLQSPEDEETAGLTLNPPILTKESLSMVTVAISNDSLTDDEMDPANVKQLNANQSNHHALNQTHSDPTMVRKNKSFTMEGSHNHPHRDKPHGHHHGHSHDLSSVRAIAYTIIAGDGLHNFCDGIAIGSAFANSLSGGLSTSIAVLCHELPHELGDFAVLLHAGMSIKSALFYNLLSSLLCTAGMVIGLLLGRLTALDSWLFMLAAGMFVYIALVDMMPELSATQLKGDKRCHQPSVLFFWQNCGILIGYCIMLLIALYEDKIIIH